MDVSKINEQIEAMRTAAIKAEMDLISESTARLEAARLENEKRRIAADKDLQERSERQLELRKQAETTAKEVERAELARVRAEEHKQNLAQEVREREEKAASDLKKNLDNLQHQHDMALKALKNSFEMSANSEKYKNSDTSEQEIKDGSTSKNVTSNTDGEVNPLKNHLLSVNK
jgi:tRNA G18 (ribose-2'-O)-methylase SpoU